MRIPQFDSFHTAHSRMQFVSHWKRSEAHYSVLLWVALFCLKPFPVPFSSSSTSTNLNNQNRVGLGLWGRLTFTTFICMSLLYLWYLATLTERHRHKLGSGSDRARAAQSLTPPAPRSRGRLGQVTDPDRHARTMYAAKCLVTNRNTNWKYFRPNEWKE